MSERVSVVVPTIDESDELCECFDCLAAQDHDDFDVLVVDSGTGVNQRVVDDYVTASTRGCCRRRRTAFRGRGTPPCPR